jgi:uncharacterized protein YjbI with pentapeptide repeats
MSASVSGSTILLNGTGVSARASARRRSRSAPWLAIALVIASSGATLARELQLQTIALPGQSTSPGGRLISDFNDWRYGTTSNVVINNAGQVAFFAGAAADGENQATYVFRSSGGGISEITRVSGSPTPPAIGLPVSMNASGQVGFGLFRNGFAKNLYRGDGGPLTEIVVFDELLPDGTRWRFGQSTVPVLNDAGQMAFAVFSIAPDASRHERIVRGDGGSFTEIVREGQTTPDGGRTFEFFSQYAVPALNNAGQVAFDAYYYKSGEYSPEGIYRGDGGPLTEIARRGTVGPSGETFYQTFGSLLNNAGQVAFGSYLAYDFDPNQGNPNDMAIYRGDGISLTQIARSSQPVPDGSGWLQAFLQHDFNDAGQDAFMATIQCGRPCGAQNVTRGIFRGDGTQLSEIARVGQTVPGGNPDRVIESFASNEIKINRAGQVAFVARLNSIEPGEPVLLGLYVGDGTQLIEIARVDDVVDLGPDLGGLTTVGLIPSIPWIDWNDFGQLAFQLRFGQNGSDFGGIFVSNAVAHIPGDINNDGTVNAADYVVWRKTGGTDDYYNAWRTNFGRSLFVGSGAALSAAPLSTSVPEPTSLFLLVSTSALVGVVRRSIVKIFGYGFVGRRTISRFAKALCRQANRAPADRSLWIATVGTWNRIHRFVVSPHCISESIHGRKQVMMHGWLRQSPGARFLDRLLLLCQIILAATIVPIRADVYQWEYNNPADPSQGKRPSTTLCPDGAGADTDYSHLNLTMGYFSPLPDLTGAFFRETNLTNAYFDLTTLDGADFTGAEVRGAGFPRGRNPYYSGDYYTGGLTPAQLYSTASYQAHDLAGISLESNNFSGASFAGQKLSLASFRAAPLRGADFTNAEIRGARLDRMAFYPGYRGYYVVEISYADSFSTAQLTSTASYQNHDLRDISLIGNDLKSANFSGQDMRNINLEYALLNNADFSGADLRGAKLAQSIKTGANFAGSNVRGTDFARRDDYNTGITLAQLYSTASYQEHDLTGINLFYNILWNANFANQNLTGANLALAALAGANFSGANLTNTNLSARLFGAMNLTGAEVRGANFGSADTGLKPAHLYSTASYQSHDLSGIGLSYIDLSGAKFADQNLTKASFFGTTLQNADLNRANLTDASFFQAILTGADFSGADITGANVSRYYDPSWDVYRGTGITAAQLYSTASYQAQNLSGVNFNELDLTGINLSHQSLTNTYLWKTILTGADLTAADFRGASYFPTGQSLITANLIKPDGHIDGLELLAGGLLVVRDHDGNPHAPYGNVAPIPITIDQYFDMAPDGALRFVFETDAWNSTISFAPGIPVTVDGTIELAFATDVNLDTQLGRTIKLFDWTGVNRSGAFNISSPYAWDLTQLYTTGAVTLISTVPEPSSREFILLNVLNGAVFFWHGRIRSRTTSRRQPAVRTGPTFGIGCSCR